MRRGVCTPFPVDKHNKLVRLFVNVYYDLADQRAKETFLGSLIGPRIAPQRLKISCQVLELFESAWPVCLVACSFRRDSRLDRRHFLKRDVPSPFQLLCKPAGFPDRWPRTGVPHAVHDSGPLVDRDSAHRPHRNVLEKSADWP